MNVQKETQLAKLRQQIESEQQRVLNLESQLRDQDFRHQIEQTRFKFAISSLKIVAKSSSLEVFEQAEDDLVGEKPIEEIQNDILEHIHHKLQEVEADNLMLREQAINQARQLANMQNRHQTLEFKLKKQGGAAED